MRPHILFLLAAFTGLDTCQGQEPNQIPDYVPGAPTCAAGDFLCVYFAGQSCIKLYSDDTCCDDGSGICSNGFECGTGVAAGRCCQSGTTPEQCASAVIVGTATTRPPPPKSTKATKTKTKALKHTSTKKPK